MVVDRVGRDRFGASTREGIVVGVTLVTSETPGAAEVTVWDLTMAERPPPSTGPAPADLLLRETVGAAPELSRFFYREVGAGWHWVDRLDWSDDRWLAWVDREQHHLWSCWLGGAPVGYFELEQQEPGVVELAYFGLLPRFHGLGYGRWFLEQAIDTAWALPGTERLWLHTWSLDGPAALGNYRSRGFEIDGTHVEYRLVP